MPSTPEGIPSQDPIQRHPPERRDRKKDCILFYSCCCCCCCCLHTIGAAIGATRGINYCSKLDPFASHARGVPSIRFLYDTSLLIVFALVTCGFMLLLGPSEPFVEKIAFVLGSFVLAGPLWLLAASVVMAVRLAIRQDLPSKAEYWMALRRVTVYSVIGCIVGTGLMLVGLLAFM